MEIFNGSTAIDDRGTVKFINDFKFDGVKRFYQVENHRRGFVRAFHGHKLEGKYVYVVKGAALIGVCEMDNDGDLSSIPELKLPQKFVLCEEVPKILWIPPRHANGFMSLRDNTIVQFFSTSTLEESKNDDIRYPYNIYDIWQEDFR
jgi:dTDP-4-dehydrorhamnose 3,5-epimerase